MYIEVTVKARKVHQYSNINWFGVVEHCLRDRRWTVMTNDIRSIDRQSTKDLLLDSKFRRIGKFSKEFTTRNLYDPNNQINVSIS